MSSHRSPGRPLEFIPAETIERVMGLFWRNGYRDTSMEDLEACTGLARSSLYNTFGSKRDVYLEVLRRYQSKLEHRMFSPLEGGTSGLADVCAFFRRLGKGLSCTLGHEDSLKGCLMINGMVEFGGSDAEVDALARHFQGRFLDAMKSALRRAAVAREIPAESVESRARLLLTVAIGINVASRSGAPDAEVRALARAAEQEVANWRPSP